MAEAHPLAVSHCPRGPPIPRVLWAHSTRGGVGSVSPGTFSSLCRSVGGRRGLGIPFTGSELAPVVFGLAAQLERARNNSRGARWEDTVGSKACSLPLSLSRWIRFLPLSSAPLR